MTIQDLWGVNALDLEAYLKRIGSAPWPPSVTALDQLIAAHLSTFSFDNVDVLLGTHPGVSLEAVSAKFIGRGRGGYCYEHVTLFAAALERLGYGVRRLLGRRSMVKARTHMSIAVTIPGEDGERLVDIGMGQSLAVSLPLVDGAESRGVFRHKVVRQREPDEGWQVHLWRGTAGEWELFVSSDNMTVRPADVAMAHMWSSNGGGPFNDQLFVGRYLSPSNYVGITIAKDGYAVTERTVEKTERQIVPRAAALKLVRGLVGGLTDDEIAQLDAKLALLDTDVGLFRDGD